VFCLPNHAVKLGRYLNIVEGWGWVVVVHEKCMVERHACVWGHNKLLELKWVVNRKMKDLEEKLRKKSNEKESWLGWQANCGVTVFLSNVFALPEG